MKISEIKALVPLADTYELRPGCRYVTVLDVSEPFATVESLIRSIRSMQENEAVKIEGVIVFAHNPKSIRFFEFPKD